MKARNLKIWLRELFFKRKFTMASLKNACFVLLLGIMYPSVGQMMPTRTIFNQATGKAETTMNPLYQPYYGNPNRKPTPKYDLTVTLNDDTSIALRSSLVVKKTRRM